MRLLPDVDVLENRWVQLALTLPVFLWIGWPIVGVVTVLQTLLMFSKLVRRHHGFKV